jgi:diguanylate cyclase
MGRDGDGVSLHLARLRSITRLMAPANAVLGRVRAALLPELARCELRRRRVVTGVLLFTLATLALNLGHTGFGLAAGHDVLMNAWLQNVVLAGATALAAARIGRAERGRGGWIALALAIAAWSLGNLYWNAVLYSEPEPPFPSWADAGWLLFYPAAYACLGLRLRAAARDLPKSLWVDGLLGLLSVCAVGVLVIAPVIDGADGPRAAVLVNSLYPVCDLLLFALCVAVFALHGWRPGRGWIALTLGFGFFAAANSFYLLRLVNDTYQPGSVLDSAWVVGLVAMSLAAWQPAPDRADLEIGDRAVLFPPFACSLAALGVLVWAGVDVVPLSAIILAAAALVASMVRTALTFGEIGRLAEVRRLAATDELTGLPNRRHFNERLAAGLDAARRDGGRLALLLIDLDRFKELNDALGHHAGDLVLAQVGPRLGVHLRTDDALARLGGDEFAVLLQTDGGAERVGRRLLAALDESFTIDGVDVRVGGSIGIALYPEDGTDAATLLQRADVAMYQAKASGSGLAFYAQERDEHTRARLELISELREAIGTSQLVLHYQPKLDVVTGRVRDVEALVRWQHPTRGLLGPGAFVPLAEQTGVMQDLTMHVLETALMQYAEWRASGLDLEIAINVSATTLRDDDWGRAVAARLREVGVPAHRLRIEITENAIMTDTERSLTVVRAIAEAGIGLSLDDFGTGYSSLSLLKRLPVDELKIDRGFIAEMLGDPADAAIVQTAIDLGRRLGLRVVAEGIEDEGTLDQLMAWGVDTAQGYFVSRPLPPDELERWLADRAAALPLGTAIPLLVDPALG